MSKLEKYTNLLKKKWYVQSCSATPIHIISAALSGFSMKKKIGLEYTHFLFPFKKDQGKMAYDVDDLEKTGKTIVDNLQRDSKYLQKIRKIYDKDQKDSERLFKRIEKLDLRKISDKELFELLQKAITTIDNGVGVGHIIEAYALTTDESLKQELSEHVKDKRQLNGYFVLLTTPTEKSFLNEADESLAKIAKARNKDKLIKEYIKKFWWIKNTYAGKVNLTKEDIMKEIENYKESEPADFKKIKHNKNRLLKELKLPASLIINLNATEFVTTWQDDRKMHILMAIGYLENLLVELSRRIDIPVSLLRYATVKEFNPNIGKMKKQLEERRNGSFYIMLPNKIEVLTGKDYEDALKFIEQEHSTEIKELTGNTASLGRAVGRVKVCLTISSIMKVEKGDILVASMTRPEYVPAMKKAAAIITDEGGITSHAAIVARELGIPCIIGTKIATKVLKDYDLVEVKANHGLVIIQKRADEDA